MMVHEDALNPIMQKNDSNTLYRRRILEWHDDMFTIGLNLHIVIILFHNL